MNRYLQSNITSRFDGKRVYKTTRYPIIPSYSSDVYIVASETDYLDSLAKQFYKDETLWWVIAQANNIKGTMKPTIGQQLRIPGNVEDVISRFVRENS